MLDFILGIYLAGLAVRGWLRGFIRELLDLVGLIVGAAVAFRLSEPLGDFISVRFGVGPESARIGAGIVLFILFGVTVSVVAHYLSKVMNLPGLTLINRALGAAVAAAWGVFLVVVVLSLVEVLPVPASWDEAVEESVVAQALAGPDAVPRLIVEPIIGDRAMSSLAFIEALTGGRRIVPEVGESVDIGAFDEESVLVVAAAVPIVSDRINASRLEEGAGSLTWSDGLGRLATDRALAMYRRGAIRRQAGADVLSASQAVGLSLERADEMVALAASHRAAHDAISEAPSTVLADQAFTRVGVGVVEGPAGVLVVELYGR